MKKITKKPWFGPKRWGWGFRPITWEGWVSMLVLITVVISLIIKYGTYPYLILYLLGLVGVFMIFCFLTGSKPGTKL